MRKMSALYLENGRLRYQTAVSFPNRLPNWAILEVQVAGICATDIEVVKGYGNGFTGILGHEFVGKVVRAPDRSWMGKRVVSEINIGCGKCDTCLHYGPEHCVHRGALGIHSHHGVFADFVAVPIDNLHSVPDSVPDETAVFAEPFAAALRIREQLLIRPSAKTAVVGPGRLGMLVGFVLKEAGHNVTMIGRRVKSLELAKSLGFQTALGDALEDSSLDVVIDTTGSSGGFETALRLIRPLGTIVLKSTFTAHQPLDLNKLVVGEVTVLGSRCGPFAPALEMMRTAQIPFERLVDGEYALADGLQAFEHAQQPGVRKILLRP